MNVYSLFHYSKTLKELLYQVKFHSNKNLALQLSPLFLRIFEYFKFDKGDSLLHVPISNQRLNKRGFNQVDILASSLKNHFKEEGSVYRMESTRALYNLDRDQRQDEMDCVFYSDFDFSKKNILLVDDIITSGATLIKLSDYLYSKGARNIKAITLAYKI